MATHKPISKRFIELDLLRGFAIVFMIFFHILWDLDYFGIYPLNSTIYRSNVIIQILFFTLVGVCLIVSINKNHDYSKKHSYMKIIRHGLWIFSLGMVITIITLLFMPERPIFFGVLHCIGLCVILSVPFLKIKHYNFVFATVFISIGFIVSLFNVNNPTALHLIVGLHPANFWTYTIDYFPLFPWFGVSLLGIAIGGIMYKDNKRRFVFPDLSKYKPVAVMSWFGRHSLFIYLAHQPIIAGVLSLYLIL
ncbi:MAG: DUF1624 domain-containing protein [Thermoplasmatales archaeon]|nr:MAG: DUF1624 domain-containing protein [Thermoplasmatales archaeon]